MGEMIDGERTMTTTSMRSIQIVLASWKYDVCSRAFYCCLHLACKRGADERAGEWAGERAGLWVDEGARRSLKDDEEQKVDAVTGSATSGDGSKSETIYASRRTNNLIRRIRKKNDHIGMLIFVCV